ncbi:MAG: hypothetical protein FGM24_00730 [Candidatus Kapabacteria bacterium]|nr:hypothetical protein [Candidatus Kapabacteria bacterium]
MYNASTTISNILREVPAAANVFHRYNLDFCCGGNRPLDVACRERSLDAQKVLGEINAADSTDVFRSIHPEEWSTEFLIKFLIENHHAFARVALNRVIEQMSKVVSKHGERFAEAQSILELLQDLRQSMIIHMDKEEAEVLVAGTMPVLTNDTVANIRRHESEHDEVGMKLQRLRAITNDFVPPASACTTHRAAYLGMQQFYTDTMQHVFLENSILFPRLTQNNLDTLITY